MNKGLLIAISLLMSLATGALADISGSKHDFSSWTATGQLCVPCHTPHNGDPSFDYGPLWNHASTEATFTLYSSPTLDATMEQPGGVSKLCLSCHDGTVAMDSFGGATGSEYIPEGKAKIGTDLSDDHPVGFRWEHQTVEGCGSYCHFGAGGDPYSYEVRFYNHRVECSTCHDPHNGEPENGTMLREPTAGSELCLICHTDKS